MHFLIKVTGRQSRRRFCRNLQYPPSDDEQTHLSRGPFNCFRLNRLDSFIFDERKKKCGSFAGHNGKHYFLSSINRQLNSSIKLFLFVQRLLDNCFFNHASCVYKFVLWEGISTVSVSFIFIPLHPPAAPTIIIFVTCTGSN